MKGRVARIVSDRGFGFVKGSDGKDYFFHRSAVQNATFETLRQGDEVEFEDTDGQKGLRAENVCLQN